MRKRVFMSATVVWSTSILFGQQPSPQRPLTVAGAGRKEFLTAEVHPDHKITFRILAPNAPAVQLIFANRGYAMTKGEAPASVTNGNIVSMKGVWSATVGPVEPGIYPYSFDLGGARVQNDQVEVPGNPPRYDELQNVPHGSITLHTYFGKVQNRERNLRVYVPPQYYSEPNRKFPVLYLWNGGDEVGWTAEGRVNVVLDNLIAQNKAVPMIVVMPHNRIPSTRVDGLSPNAEIAAVIEKEMPIDIIPMIETDYRVLRGRNNRAMAGLSYGGGTTFNVGMRHLDMYAYLGTFGTGTFGGLLNAEDGSFVAYQRPYNPEQIAPGIYKNLVTPDTKLKLFYISVGEEDPRFPATKEAAEDFRKHGIEVVFTSFPGGHEFKFFRRAMADCATMLFK
jgi:enterochelin esterase family protein